MSFKKNAALLALPFLLLVFAWSCDSNKTPATPAAPVTIYYAPTLGTSTNTPTITVTSTATSSSTPTASPTATLHVHPTQATATPVPTSVWSLVSTLGRHGTDGINGDFMMASSVALGGGFVAVGDAGYPNVQVFDSYGNWLYSIPGDPTALAIDSYGELYVGTGDQVNGYDLAIGGYTYDYTWSGQGEINQADAIAIDPNGNLVVGSNTPGVIFNLAWADDTVLNRSTGLSGTLTTAGLATDAGGNIYCVGSINGGTGVGVFNPDYVFTRTINGNDWPTTLGLADAITVDPSGNLYIGMAGPPGYIFYCTNEGTFLGIIVAVANPVGLAVDNAGDLFVAGGFISSVYEYSK